MTKNFQRLRVAFWNEYFPQLCKSVMSCEGHDIAATKSSTELCEQVVQAVNFVSCDQLGSDPIVAFYGIKTEK